MAEKVAVPTAGESTCPMCGRHWTVTPYDDCLLPACGHFGDDTGPDNPDRPCHWCGLAHAWKCVLLGEGSKEGGDR